jgi:hypothetical protein
MATLYNPDFSKFVDDLSEYGPKVDVLDSSEPRSMDVKVSDVRRRRGRITDEMETGYRDVSLVERDGVLLWVLSSDLSLEGTQRRYRRRGMRALRRTEPGARVLKEVSVPILEPNEYVAALSGTDEYLNSECGTGLRVVQKVERNGAVAFEATKEGLKQQYTGKTLVIVHGTFSSSKNSLGEYAATEQGRQFLSDALKAYQGQVLVFDHPTLSVSPFLNALDLARAMQGSTGSVDVIAHSRGGVLVRWWLEVLGDGLAGAKVRAILAGSPLKGTSLAAPNRVQPFLSVLSNIGSFVTKTLQIAAAANPFTLASFALLRFIVRREKNNWGFPPIDGIGSRPGVDAAVAVIPGLQGQSAVQNNQELERLWTARTAANVQYFAITANFEPERMGWRLWKVITEFGTRTTDALADKVFPGENDLVVDTAHMTYLGEKTAPIANAHAFRSQSEVHHCSYFRQPATLDFLRQSLGVP